MWSPVFVIDFIEICPANDQSLTHLPTPNRICHFAFVRGWHIEKVDILCHKDDSNNGGPMYVDRFHFPQHWHRLQNRTMCLGGTTSTLTPLYHIHSVNMRRTESASGNIRRRCQARLTLTRGGDEWVRWVLLPVTFPVFIPRAVYVVCPSASCSDRLG